MLAVKLHDLLVDVFDVLVEALLVGEALVTQVAEVALLLFGVPTFPKQFSFVI